VRYLFKHISDNLSCSYYRILVIIISRYQW